MGKRGAAWSDEETECLLRILEKYLPICPDEWERVKTLFDEDHGDKARSTKALERRFVGLHRTTEPTGDPNIPPHVIWAKEVSIMIRDKTDGTRGSPNFDELLVEDEEDIATEGAQGDEPASEAASTPAANTTTTTAIPRRSPVPSIQFTGSVQSLRQQSIRGKKKDDSESEKFSFTNFMSMMMLQQQADREERQQMMKAESEYRQFQAEQSKIEREERAEQSKIEREERAEQARSDRTQQQQFMNMMMMSMMGGGKKRDNDEMMEETRKSPRKG